MARITDNTKNLYILFYLQNNILTFVTWDTIQQLLTCVILIVLSFACVLWLLRTLFSFVSAIEHCTNHQPLGPIGIGSQYNNRGSHLRSQLSSVITMLPTVQMHLILCTYFTSTANKHEFITLAYQLIDRLAALNHLTYPLR